MKPIKINLCNLKDPAQCRCQEVIHNPDKNFIKMCGYGAEKCDHQEAREIVSADWTKQIQTIYYTDHTGKLIEKGQSANMDSGHAHCDDWEGKIVEVDGELWFKYIDGGDEIKITKDLCGEIEVSDGKS